MRRRSSGMLLPAVLGALVLFSILYFAVSWTTQQARHRLMVSKYQETARWLADSALEVGQSRLRKGQLQQGQTVRASFPQGQFTVTLRNGELIATGLAGGQSHQERQAAR